MRRANEALSFRQSLVRLLQSKAGDEKRLLAGIEARQRAGLPAYATTISILTHLDFPEARARRHWQGVLAHRRQMAAALGRDPGLRVALLDYFVNRTRELKSPKVIELALYQRTEQSALTDALTGLFNRSYLLHAIRREISRSARHHRPLAVALFDLDDFKRINDTYGHPEGDRVLMRAAALMAECLREVDVASRYGGEEFAVLLPETTRDGAYVVADRIRRHLESKLRSRRERVTVSGGVAGYPQDAVTADLLLQRADQGLYRAKAEGKNRIWLAHDERRGHARVLCDHPVQVQGLGPRALKARARNLSQGGMLLSIGQQVPVGSRVTVVVRPGESGPMALRGEVVRIQRQGSRRFEAGVRLTPDGSGRQAVVLRRLAPRPAAGVIA